MTQDERRIANALAILRDGWPDMERLFMEGQCYTLAVMFRYMFQDITILYSERMGHVYFQLGSSIFDIRGVHSAKSLPKDLLPLDFTRGDKPHRWPRRDRRTLTE